MNEIKDNHHSITFWADSSVDDTGHLLCYNINEKSEKIEWFPKSKTIEANKRAKKCLAKAGFKSFQHLHITLKTNGGSR